MNSVSILIVVDALGLASSGNIKDNVYLVDSENYLGSWNEGQCDLHTLTETGQILKWSVISVSSGNQVDITGFSGQMVDQGICKPSKQGIKGAEFWEGRIKSAPGRYTYTINLSIDGKPESFTPYIEVQ